ncbi:hypothetical protein KI797_06950 [Aeromonas media]|uniref:LPS O-antigen chain length determinant protein WzzB n=1 Tax=Aeromonas media TaxID=651 RepID=UPI001CF5169D|nr:Wzz/FepE/Etk N-terminal domain-containing protein [Aeromonas media]UCP16155.1 hypothetical protein KI797_06950 [Aeromonas media]
MTNKDMIPKPDTQLPVGWQATTDEIDLRDLLLVLWRQKLQILVAIVLFALVGVGYAFFAPQQWSAKAVIVEPKPEELLPMQKVEAQATALGLKEFPTGIKLYKDFVQEFNSFENRRDYLKGSPLFAEQIKEKGLDDKAQRRWLRDWSKLVTAHPIDKKGEEPGIELTLAAPAADASLILLEGYIDYVIKRQQQQLIQRLNEKRTLQLEELATRYAVMQEDAKRMLQQDITETRLANIVAKAAGATTPLENYTNQERFPISLGSKGLEEKLSLLKSIELERYQPELQVLQAQMARLKRISLEGISFRPFSYLDAPEEPLSRDKPKRPLVVVLATLLGGMLGVGIVLVRHAFRKPEPEQA